MFKASSLPLVEFLLQHADGGGLPDSDPSSPTQNLAEIPWRKQSVVRDNSDLTLLSEREMSDL